MKKRTFSIIILTIFILILGIYPIIQYLNQGEITPTTSLAYAVITDETNKYSLDQYTEVLEDKNKSWIIEDIKQKEQNSMFQRLDDRHSFGYTDSAYWVKIQVENQTNQSDWFLEIENAALNYIDFYIEKEDGTFFHKITGDQYPFYEREVLHKNFVFKLPLETNKIQTIYARFEAGGIMFFPMNIWSPDSFARYNYQSQLIWGIYFGSMAIMLIYHLFVFFITNNKSYLYYVFTIFFLAFFQIADSGFAYEFLWPTHPVLNEVSSSVIASLSLFTFLILSKTILDAKAHAPLIYKIFNVLSGLTIISFFFSFFVPYSTSIHLLKVLFIAYLIPTLFLIGITLKNRHQPARYFLLAVSFVFLGILVSMFKSIIIPITILTDNSNKIGSILFVIFLSFSIGSYINIVKKESEQEKRQRVLLMHLHKYIRSLTETLALEDIYRLVLNSMLKVSEHQHGAFFTVQNENIQFLSFDKHFPLEKLNNSTQSIEEIELLDNIMKYRKPLFLKDEKLTLWDNALHVDSLFGIPIIHQDSILAIVLLFSSHVHEFEENILETTLDFAVQAGISIRNALLFEETKKLATFDGLTNIYNRKYFFDLAKKECERSKRYNYPLSIMMIDIDYFKEINDTYGHATGDKVLRKTADVLKDMLRVSDIVGRYGGEEFIVALPQTDIDNAYILAERIRVAIENESFPTNNGQHLSVTISIGISMLEDAHKSLFEVVDKADRALYKVKNSGRNNVDILL